MTNRGTIVLADRWPQAEICGLCDGPHTSDIAEGGWFVRAVQRYEQRLVERLRDLKPDLVIKLVVPLDTAKMRKPDHDAAMLARKVDAIQALTFDNASIVEVDATLPIEEVVRLIHGHLWHTACSVAEGGCVIR
jgi:thymidylate kinase